MYITEEDILNIIAKDDFDAALAEGFTSMEALTRTACSTMRNYLYPVSYTHLTLPTIA